MTSEQRCETEPSPVKSEECVDPSAVVAFLSTTLLVLLLALGVGGSHHRSQLFLELEPATC